MFSQTMTDQLYKLPIQGYFLSPIDELPSEGFLTFEGLRKLVTLRPLSYSITPALPLSHFPKRRAKLFRGEAKTSVFLKESNLLPRIWYLPEWGWGARHPRGWGHDPAGLHNTGRFSLRTRGATGAPDTARSNGSGSAAIGEALKLLQVAG